MFEHVRSRMCFIGVSYILGLFHIWIHLVRIHSNTQYQEDKILNKAIFVDQNVIHS